MGEYVLGTSDHELARLELQHEVWAEISEGFLDRLDIRPGMRCLDVGCGPGFVVRSLRERVGAGGEVVALDESERWIRRIEETGRSEGWDNVRTVHGDVRETELPPGRFDLIHMRWVLGFLPRPEEILARLSTALVPGGALAVMDYNHEGVSIFPRSDGFRAAIQATRDLYATRGGDTWIMGRIFELFRGAGLEPDFIAPHVIAGAPGSPALRWADAFFPFHTDGMVEAGVLSPENRELFLREWEQLLSNPDTLFFSPIVAGAAARKRA